MTNATTSDGTEAQKAHARSLGFKYVDAARCLKKAATCCPAVLAAADLVIIPVVPERAAVTPTFRTAELVAEAGVPYRVVLNLVDPLRGAGPVESMWEALDGRGVPRMRSVIRRYVAHSQSQLNGEMITQYRGDASWRKALDDMRRFHAELLLGRIDSERRP